MGYDAIQAVQVGMTSEPAIAGKGLGGAGKWSVLGCRPRRLESSGETLLPVVGVFPCAGTHRLIPPHIVLADVRILCKSKYTVMESNGC
jgi:hypothetical protein